MDPPASQQPVITPEDVLESLMNDGIIDAMRLRIITQLKAKEDLKNMTIKMVEQSKVLNTPGAEKQTKRELFDALRQELETSVLEMASKSVWELILDNNGLGREISETVENVFCRLSGTEPPLFPEIPPTIPEQVQEKETELSGGSDPNKDLSGGKDPNKDSSGGRDPNKDSSGGRDANNLIYYTSNASAKKRKLDELNIRESPGEVAGSSASLDVWMPAVQPH